MAALVAGEPSSSSTSLQGIGVAQSWPTYATELIGWYRANARGFIADFAPQRLEQFDEELTRIERLLEASARDVEVYFLGNSGVGKSTLMNALVAREKVVLPQGGIGPLTAQAIEVRYAERPYFAATYLPGNALNRLLFGLERHHEARLRKSGLTVAGNAADIGDMLTEEDRKEAEAAIALVEGIGEDAPAESSKIDQFARRAQLLIRGEQWGQVSLPSLLDGLRLALGLQSRWGAELSPEDTERVLAIQECLLRAKNGSETYRVEGAPDDQEFLQKLDTHASGHLAPLLKTLEVGWPAEILADGAVLVDLPGLGTANDQYPEITNDRIRRAKVLVLVVDRSGVAESSVQVLQSTGFLNALLHDSHDPQAEPISMLIAMVKVDLSADDSWRKDRDQAGKKARSWVAHFEDCRGKAINLVNDQIRHELRRMVEAGPEATRSEREAATQKVLAQLQVHPVSAIELRKLIQQDDEDRPRIHIPEQSQVPHLAEHLKVLVAGHRHRAYLKLRQNAVDFRDRVLTAARLVQAQWEADGRADAEMERLRVDLEAFLAPLRRELDPRRGGFREFLKSTIPSQIEARTDEATLSARADIAKHLHKYDEYHWSTLRAAVTRYGYFDGARLVDIPSELTLRFEQPVAVVWSKHILTALRKRTKELSEDYISMLDQVITWVRQEGARAQPKLVEAMREDLQSDAKQFANVGKDAIDELKEAVRKSLLTEVQKRVRARCKKFVEDDYDNTHGRGVKKRLLKFVREDLTDTVVDTARPAALRVLQNNYAAVEEEIRQAYNRYGNPLDSAAEALVSSHEERLRRSDSQRRRKVLDAVAGIEAALPILPEDNTLAVDYDSAPVAIS
jgi:hypothetical protein